jgi:hypothetical protein
MHQTKMLTLEFSLSETHEGGSIPILHSARQFNSTKHVQTIIISAMDSMHSGKQIKSIEF